MIAAREPVKLGYTPYAHQRAAHVVRLAFRFLVLVWHRGAGKTVFAIMELVLAALKCSHKAGRYGYVAPYLKQAKSVAWDYLKEFTRDIPGVKINESETSALLPNGALIRLYGADNPDALRGIHWDGLILDEVADMNPTVWFVILRPGTTVRNGWVLFIGTPKGVNLFSELFHRAQKEEGWHAEIRRASETGVLTKEEIEKARRDMAPAQFAQEMECDFSASAEDALMKLDDILAAQKRDLKLESYEFAPKVLGVDCARFGGDRTVLFGRQGLATRKPVALDQMDTMETSARVALAIDRWQPKAVFVDNGTFGAGVVDRLRQLKYRMVCGIDFGGKASEAKFENKRAEMWWRIAQWVKDGGCLPDVPELTRDLTGPRYSYRNAHGRIQLESKDDMRSRGLKSPDYGDALALTFAQPVASDDLVGARDPSKTEHDFDPYDLAGLKHQPTQTLHEFDPYGGL